MLYARVLRNSQILWLYVKVLKKIFGFDANLFSKGAMAEITVIDPDYEWTFDKNHIYSKSGNSPFIGESLKGKVELTISTNSIYKRQ